MLIEFSVTNFLSIRERITLSLVKGSGAEHAESNFFESAAQSTPDILASAVIYGPNAAGKSNVIRALAAMQEIVRESASEKSVGDRLPVTPFRLDSTSKQEPSEFELVFVIDGVRYQYGFSATSKRIESEWLFSFPKGRPRQLIDRSYSESNENWGNMNMLSGPKQVWQNATRPNALFLSTAVQLNSKDLVPIFDWIVYGVRIVDHGGWFREFTAKRCLEGDREKLQIEHLLRVADTDIDKVEVEEKAFDSTMFPDDMPGAVRDEIIRQIGDTPVYVVRTVHLLGDGKVVKFNIKSESDGTQKLFGMAGAWLDALESGYTLVVDELNDSLHSHMVRFLVQMFHEKRINKRAQLIFSTHDTSLLSQDIFRRDQIWLCEKNAEKSTELYPLTDFSPRKDVENLERGYLAGRYGAVPFMQDLVEVLGEP